MRLNRSLHWIIHLRSSSHCSTCFQGFLSLVLLPPLHAHCSSIGNWRLCLHSPWLQVGQYQHWPIACERDGTVSILIGVLINAGGFCVFTLESQLPFKRDHLRLPHCGEITITWKSLIGWDPSLGERKLHEERNHTSGHPVTCQLSYLLGAANSTAPVTEPNSFLSQLAWDSKPMKL